MSQRDFSDQPHDAPEPPLLRLIETPEPRLGYVRPSADEIVIELLGLEGARTLWARRARQIRATLHEIDSPTWLRMQVTIAEQYERKAGTPLLRAVAPTPDR